jgi:acetyltransferase-like isoleucine patch superfamily enzyme
MLKQGHNKAGWVEPVFDANGMSQWGWRVSHLQHFKLGNNVQIGTFTMIDAQEGVEIKDNVMVGFSCVILSYSSIDNKSGKVILQKGCRIGANSVIMPDVEIGENATVGANSLVTESIPPSEVWAGTPAKFIRYFRDTP